MDSETTHSGKWGMWTFDELLLTCTYGYILFVHYSKWRDKLPRESVHSIINQILSDMFLYLLVTYLQFLTPALCFANAARPAFYNYAVIMFVVHGAGLLACTLGACGVGFGIW